MSDTVYWLQLVVDGYPDRARLLASSERWSTDSEKREIADLLVQLIDKWEDDVEAQVEAQVELARDEFEPDWSDCPNCPGHEQEVESLQSELDDVVEERDGLRVENAKGHCPGCGGNLPASLKKCSGGLVEE